MDMTDNELLEYCRNKVDSNTELVNELINKIDTALEKLNMARMGNVLSDAYYNDGDTIQLINSSRWICSKCVLMVYDGNTLIETDYIYSKTTKIEYIGNLIRTLVESSDDGLNVHLSANYRLRAIIYG